MRKKIVALLLAKMVQKRVLASRELARLKKIADVRPNIFPKLDTAACKVLIKDADAVISSWGTPKLEKEILDCAPHLKLIAHAAGSVKPVVSDEVWKRKIRVTTTAPSIALSVAQFTLGMMLLYSLRIRKFEQKVIMKGWAKIEDKLRCKGLYDITIGILGAGFVGQKVMEYLKAFDVAILLYDPTLSREQADRLGATKAGIEQLAKHSDIISSHAPSIPATYHLIGKKIFGLMKKDVLIVNTSRGSVIDEKAMVAFLKKNKEAFACIDVTDPEPPAANNPLRRMKNVLLTPHLAGTGANLRQGRYAVTEIQNLFAGKKLVYEVTNKMLGTMA